MSLRARIILIHLAVVGLVAGGVVAVVEWSTGILTEENIRAADAGVDGVARANLALSKDVLTRYGEAYVEQVGTVTALEVSAALHGRDWHDYDTLRADDTLRGLATRDIVVIALGPDAPPRRAGYCDVMDKTGLSVLHPHGDAVEGHNFQEWEKDHPVMWKLVEEAITAKPRRIVSGVYTFFDRDQRKRSKFMAVVPVPETDFFICATVFIDEYFTPVHEKIRELSQSASAAARLRVQAADRQSRQRMRLWTLLAVAVLAVASVLVGIHLSGRIAKPILELRDGVKRIGKGDFSFTVAEGGIPEIAELKRSVNALGGQLQAYLDELTHEVIARQAVESELSVASRIQQTLLPHVFPPFPERPEFEMHALNLAAKQVGGDFYDFFFVSPDHLAILIGDVSGKGVPASLFMAVSRTVMRIVCEHNNDPAAALAEANNLLCRDNDTNMFVTLLLACYDVKTGKIVFASAGHNPPFLLRGPGDATMLDLPSGLILGVLEDETYEATTVQLDVGQAIVLYTDGVTEATAPGGELFGDERLGALLADKADLNPEDLVEEVTHAAMDFQVNHQFDDITLVAWRREA